MSRGLKAAIKGTNTDEFFMHDAWSYDNLAAAENISLGLMKIYAGILSEYHNLPQTDAYHLSREMAYHVISMFLDTCLRLKIIKDKQIVVQDNDTQFNQKFDKFFKTEATDYSLGSSMVLRVNFTNLIAASLGYKDIFATVNHDPEKIELKDTGIRFAGEQDIWLSQYYFSKLLDKVSYSLKISLNQIFQRMGGNRVRIGYIEIDKKYFLQIPHIKLVPLNIDLTYFLAPVSFDKKMVFYKTFLTKFLKGCRSRNDLSEFIGGQINEKTLSILFASLIFMGEPLLFDPEKFKAALLFCRNKIESNNLQALFSVGNWFRFSNIIIAIAARKCGLPVIEYQLGGRCIYKIEEGGGHGESNVDYYLAWGQWDKEYQRDTSGRLLKAPSPYLYELNDKGQKRKRRHSRNFNVLYSTIGLSHLFRIENSFSFNPDQIKPHRLLIQKAFEELDRGRYSKDINLFIKIKGFDYTLYRDHEYMLFPKPKLKNMKIKYIFKKNSETYFNFINLHFLDGLGTSFVFSLAYNIPSLAFLNNNILRIYDQYMPLVSRMIELGVIATNPLEACRIIERYYLEPDYWIKKEIQEIRKEYLNIFGYFSKDWKEEIGSQLTSIAKTHKKIIL